MGVLVEDILTKTEADFKNAYPFVVYVSGDNQKHRGDNTARSELGEDGTRLVGLTATNDVGKKTEATELL